MDGLSAPQKRGKVKKVNREARESALGYGSAREGGLGQAKKIIKKTNKITKAKKENMSDKKSALRNLLSVLITALIVGGGIYAWQDKAKDNSLTKVQQDARNTREGFERSLKNLENKVRKVEDENEELVVKNEELEDKAGLIEGALKEYTSEELGLNFSYPAILGTVSYEKFAGASGEKFSIKFSRNENFHMSGVSADYKEIESATSTEANFDNFIKIKKEKDEYKYYVSLDGVETEYKLKPIEVISFSGGEALLLDSKSFILEEGQIAVGIGQNLGAILNTNKEGFSGLAMLNSDFGQLSLDNFKTLLKSIEIK